MDGWASGSVAGSVPRLPAPRVEDHGAGHPARRARVSYALRVEDRRPDSRVVVEPIRLDEGQET